MKKKTSIFVVVALLIIGIVFAYLFFQRTEPLREDERVYITKGQASRMLVCLANGSLEGENSAQWYKKYIDFMIANKYADWEYDFASEFYATPYSYEDLLTFLKATDFDVRELEKFTNIKVVDNKGRLVSKTEFGIIYDYLVTKSGDKGHVVRSEMTVVATPSTLSYEDLISLGRYRCVTTFGTYEFEGLSMDAYCDSTIYAYVSGKSIVGVITRISDYAEYKNVWITGSSSRNINVYMYGITRSFPTPESSGDFAENIADIVVSNHTVTSLTVKKDTVNGKVLKLSNEKVVLEGYGAVEISEDFKVYNLCSEVSQTGISSILVGYNMADFVVEDGKVCAALITRELNAQNIRVLIMDTAYESVFHDRVSITSESAFKIEYEDVCEEYEAEEIVDIYPDSSMLSEGRVKISAVDNKSKIILLSVERSYGNPAYTGEIEVALEGEHLVIINELPLEKYLCYVVPSEMPVKYGVEALKCMAVCARSYAYQHILGNNYRMYGAHVDDSVSFQVYNNIKPQENSTQAVKETHGQILQDMAGNVVTAYYYSTSCGYGSDLSVWGNTASDIYCSGAINPAHEKYDLSSETAFRSFLDNERQEDFDYEFPYYRWSVYVPCEDASSRFNEYLQRRVATHSGEIYLADENGNDIGGNIEEISDIGAIFDMQILERTGCGLVKKILVRGTNANIVISGELNIRYLLGPGENELHTHLDTTTTFYILPSAYMYFELDKTDGELKGIRYYGGGYGHGIGMSQNAVYAMVKCGMRYDEILSYFYQNTKLGQIS